MDDGIDDLRKRAQSLLPENVEGEATLQELKIHQIELELQNDELRQRQLEVEATRDRLEKLFEFAPVGYLILDESGVVVQANLTACKLLGVSRAALPDKPFIIFLERDDHAPFFQHLGRVFSSERSSDSCELSIRPRGGPPWR